MSTSLQELCVSNLEFLSTLHGGFSSLRHLSIQGCMSPQIGMEFWSSLQILVTLQELSVGHCDNLDTVPSLDNLTSLVKLSISHCSRLTCLPSLASLTCLKELSIGLFWDELESFPDFQVIPQLESLDLWGWPLLESLPEQIQHFTSLTFLRISCFDGLEALPEWLGNLTTLEYLDIGAMQRLTKLKSIFISECPLLKERCNEESGPEWPKISHIPQITDDLTSLIKLSISHCSRLTCLPSLASLTCLKRLSIGLFWEELESFPDFQVIPQLETLVLWGWPLLKSLPEQINTSPL
ncbi:hypothetical protein ACLB2K_063913 [Fragaria x ananassa]